MIIVGGTGWYKVKLIHNQDLKRGFGTVSSGHLPRFCPNS